MPLSRRRWLEMPLEMPLAPNPLSERGPTVSSQPLLGPPVATPADTENARLATEEEPLSHLAMTQAAEPSALCASTRKWQT